MNAPLYAKVDTASKDAYRRIAEARYIPHEEVHRHDICQGVSALILGHELIKDNSAFHLEGRLLPIFGNETGFYAEHHYLVYEDRYGVEEIVDASWQQFLPANNTNDNLPKVLIGNRSDFVDYVLDAGMPQEAVDFWRPLDKAETVIKVVSNPVQAKHNPESPSVALAKEGRARSRPNS